MAAASDTFKPAFETELATVSLFRPRHLASFRLQRVTSHHDFCLSHTSACLDPHGGESENTCSFNLPFGIAIYGANTCGRS
mmetsp:Transcript_35679/g.106482  ORF Transcript_35679/g.106482 Transcript_35679/m.106482 type:complete len:81 (-) Transcript_35679:231-473(-)